METECSKVGLGLNGPKTKYLTYSIDDHPPLSRHSPLSTRNGTVMEEKSDFKYLGSWVDESVKDIIVRKGLAWKALNDMNRVWKSIMNLIRVVMRAAPKWARGGGGARRSRARPRPPGGGRLGPFARRLTRRARRR